MALSREQSIQLYGTEAYTGWGETEAAGDAQAKGLTGGGSSGGGGFDFDFAAAAEEAYGDLGKYYDRILRESKGDTNLALSRLTEDYERGNRIRAEDLAYAKEGLNLTRVERERQLANVQAAKGINRASLYDPSGGTGLGQQQKTRLITEPFTRQEQRYDTQFRRGQESSDIAFGRGGVDLRRAQERFEAEQERQRRLEAAQLANLRGERAYQKYSSELV